MGGGRLFDAFNAISGHKVYLDLFGGSGFISNTIKKQNPQSRVIWNDFDNYNHRLELIPQTNVVHQYLTKLFENIPSGKNIRSYPDIFTKLNVYLQKLPEDSDWITIGSWLLFSGKYAAGKIDLIAKINQSCWNNLVKSPLISGDYLNNVERVSCDWREVLVEYGSLEDVCIIADPPYLYTDNSGYSNEITASDTLDLFEICLNSKSYMLFTTGRLDVIDLVLRLDKKKSKDTKKIIRRSKLNAKLKNYLSEVCYYK